MGHNTKDLVQAINKISEDMLNQMNTSVSNDKRGQKAAALRARKSSLELEKLLLKYRKQSVKDIG